MNPGASETVWIKEEPLDHESPIEQSCCRKTRDLEKRDVVEAEPHYPAFSPLPFLTTIKEEPPISTYLDNQQLSTSGEQSTSVKLEPKTEPSDIDTSDPLSCHDTTHISPPLFTAACSARLVRCEDSRNTTERMDLKKNRGFTPIAQRLEILKRHKKGVSISKLARETGVSERTIRDWKKNHVKIEQWCSEVAVNSRVQSCKKIQKAANEDLDQAVYTWFTENRLRGIPLSGPIIQSQALKMYEEMGGSADFDASTGWLRNFKKRHGIRLSTVCGERLSGDEAAAKKFIQEFSKVIHEEQLTPDQVFNCAETGLNFRMVPKKTLALQSENSSPGFEKLKNRVTVLACANASGTLKLKLMVIGKNVKPRAFKHINTSRLPVFYRNQESAWMDSTLFKEWFSTEFVPRVSNFLKEQGFPTKAVLFVDSAPAHSSSEELTNGNIKTMFFPPNTTSLIQPMDQGVLETLKRDYRQKLMSSVVTMINENVNVVQHLKTVTIKEVVFWLAEAWEKTPIATIQKSWQKIWPGRNTPEYNREERTKTNEEKRLEANFIIAVRQIEGCEDVDETDLQNWMVNDFIADPMPSNAGIISMSKGGVGDGDDRVEEGATLCETRMTSEEAMNMYCQSLDYIENQMELSMEELKALHSVKDKLALNVWQKKFI